MLGRGAANFVGRVSVGGAFQEEKHRGQEGGLQEDSATGGDKETPAGPKREKQWG